MAKKVLLMEKIHEKGMSMLQEKAEVIVAPDPSEETIVSLIGDCDALIARSTPVTDRMIEAGKQLKVIGRHGIGVDNIDLESATRHGVYVMNTPQANVISVAEHLLTCMLYLTKKAHKCDEAMRAGEFSQQGSLPALVNRLGYNTIELYGKTVGFIGMGKIARRATDICVKGFGMKAYGYDPYLTPAAISACGAVPCASIVELIEQVDFVSIHVPLTAETKNLFNYNTIKLMKPTAFLINTARGGIIDEADLCRALDNGLIAGAAVDVLSMSLLQQIIPSSSTTRSW